MLRKLLVAMCALHYSCCFISSELKAVSESTALPRILIRDFVNLSSWKDGVWSIESVFIHKVNGKRRFHLDELGEMHPLPEEEQ